jgi:hypothetical protein
MRNFFIIPSLLFTSVGVGSLLSKYFSWYNTYWFTDMTLHTLSGVAFGFLWIGLHKKSHALPSFVLLVGVASFATFGSVLWEFWEFAGWLLTRAQVPFYTPTLSDALGDILCGMIGGALSTIPILLNKRK